MARFFTITSSSAGNSYYAGGGGGGLLIDAGACCKAITDGLEHAGVSISSVNGILLTHEHTDHIKGLAVLLKHWHIPVYASSPVLEYLSRHWLIPAGAVLKGIAEDGEVIGPMLVTPFRTSHDSVGSLGYRISTPDERKITIATDTGYITSEARARLTGSDLVLIESNYEPAMLEAGRYPYPLKRRIAGPCGHLSNEDCAMELPELIRNGATRIILGHLSKENNYPALALTASNTALSAAGMTEGGDYLLSVAPRSEPSDIMIF